MKNKLINLGLDEKAINSILDIVEKEYISLDKYNTDTKGLNEKIAELTKSSKGLSEKYESDIKAIKVDNAINMALTNAGAKTLKACRALINMDNIVFDESGNITGIDEQIKSLAKNNDTKYLFKSSELKGAVVGNSNSETETDTDKMSYSELCAYLEQNPSADIS